MKTNTAARWILRDLAQGTRKYHAAARVSRCLTQPRITSTVTRSFPFATSRQLPSKGPVFQLRGKSTAAEERPLTNREDESKPVSTASAEEIAERKAREPAYELTFSCRKCLHRSSHRITKQAYHFGTTLITCPGCKNRHLISDHLKIFSDKSITIEDILREKGQYMKKGRLGEDGHVEFYDDDATAKIQKGPSGED